MSKLKSPKVMVLLLSLSAVSIAISAKAEPDAGLRETQTGIRLCNDHPSLIEYSAWHEHEHAMLDHLHDTEINNLYAAYHAHAISLKHARARHNQAQGTRFLSDGEAYAKALQGRVTEASLDIMYRMLVESASDDELNNLENLLDKMLAAIKGDGDVKELHDYLYRLNVEKALAASECASDLVADYRMAPLGSAEAATQQASARALLP